MTTMPHKSIHHPLDGNIKNLAAWAKEPVDRPQTVHQISYGAVSFLAVRDRFMRRLSNDALRRWFEPAIVSSQFTIFYEGQTPRGMITWAHLTDEAQDVFSRTFEPPPLEAWFAGRNLWIMSVMSPYKGPTRQCLRWIDKNIAAETFNALRTDSAGRIVLCRYRRDQGVFRKHKPFQLCQTRRVPQQ